MAKASRMVTPSWENCTNPSAPCISGDAPHAGRRGRPFRSSRTERRGELGHQWPQNGASLAEGVHGIFYLVTRARRLADDGRRLADDSSSCVGLNSLSWNMSLLVMHAYNDFSKT